MLENYIIFNFYLFFFMMLFNFLKNGINQSLEFVGNNVCIKILLITCAQSFISFEFFIFVIFMILIIFIFYLKT
jgi:hypothetical protein